MPYKTGFFVKLQKPIFMLWRKFNGDPIELPIRDAVERAIRRETEQGYHLKVCIGTDSQVKGAETEFAQTSLSGKDEGKLKSVHHFISTTA